MSGLDGGPDRAADEPALAPTDAPTDASAAPGQPDVPARRPRWWPPLLLVVAGAALMVLRHGDTALGSWLDRVASLERLPAESLGHVDDLLLVPLASVLVVFARVALGLRMLGPFRPILIGLAFHQTGVVTGASFLIVILVVVALARPGRRGTLLPYFGRLTSLLSAVVLLELCVLMAGAALDSERLLRAAVFPIVVLCLCADGFARALSDEGMRAGAGRAAVTIMIAVGVSALGASDAVLDFLFAYPEFVLVEIGAIQLVATQLRWGLFDSWFGAPSVSEKDR